VFRSPVLKFVLRLGPHPRQATHLPSAHRFSHRITLPGFVIIKHELKRNQDLPLIKYYLINNP
jgi:hypothetical protein